MTVRINVTVSDEYNEWLDKESAKTGISKSSLASVAISQYIEQKEAITGMQGMVAIMEKLNDLEMKING